MGLRKLMAVTASAMLALTMAACGGDDDAARDRGNESAAAPVAEAPTTEAVTPEAPPAEGEYGSDIALDALWDACEGGDEPACDQLYLDSASGSEYEAFGLDCGGRGRPDGMSRCDPTYGTYGTDADLDALYDLCAGGANYACDDLWRKSPVNSEYETFAAECAGRGRVSGTTWCTENYGAYGTHPDMDALYDLCAGGDNSACDDLYFASPGGSEYEEFAETCGGRGMPEGSSFCD